MRLESERRTHDTTAPIFAVLIGVDVKGVELVFEWVVVKRYLKPKACVMFELMGYEEIK